MTAMKWLIRFQGRFWKRRVWQTCQPQLRRNVSHLKYAQCFSTWSAPVLLRCRTRCSMRLLSLSHTPYAPSLLNERALTIPEPTPFPIRKRESPQNYFRLPGAATDKRKGRSTFPPELAVLLSQRWPTLAPPYKLCNGFYCYRTASATCQNSSFRWIFKVLYNF